MVAVTRRCTCFLQCIHWQKKFIIDTTKGLLALLQFPPFKKPSFMFVLRVITAKFVMLRCKV